MALFGGTGTDTISLSTRLVEHSSDVRIAVVNGSRSRRTCSAMTISSSEAFPARSPMPLMVHSTWRAPAALRRTNSRRPARGHCGNAPTAWRSLPTRSRTVLNMRVMSCGSAYPTVSGRLTRRRAGLDDGFGHIRQESRDRCASHPLPKTPHHRRSVRARRTASTAWSRHSARVIRSLSRRCRSEVARNTWIRGRWPRSSARAARSTSR